MSELFTGESLEAAVTAAAEPSVSPTDTPSTPSTDAPPIAAQGTSVSESMPEGSALPLHRHKAILDGAYKERDTYKEQVARLAWAQGISPEEYQRRSGFFEKAQADPVAFAEQLLSELEAHPQFAQRLRSQAARMLAGGRVTKAQSEAITAALVAENGSGVYTAEQIQQLLAQQQAALEARVGDALKPLEALKQERALAEAHQKAKSAAEAQFAWLEKQPGFTEPLGKAIGEAMAADPTLPLERAYIQVVVPQLGQAAQASVVNRLHAKTQAGTLRPNAPSTAAPTPGKRPTFASALKDAFEAAAD